MIEKNDDTNTFRNNIAVPSERPSSVNLASDGWIAWKNHVLKELARLNASVEKYRENQQQILIQLAKHKVYIAMMSSIAGFVAGSIVVFLSKYFPIT